MYEINTEQIPKPTPEQINDFFKSKCYNRIKIVKVGNLVEPRTYEIAPKWDPEYEEEIQGIYDFDSCIPRYQPGRRGIDYELYYVQDLYETRRGYRLNYYFCNVEECNNFIHVWKHDNQLIYSLGWCY